MKPGEHTLRCSSYPPAGLLSIGMAPNLWASTATFKRCVPEKVSFVLLNQVDLALTVLAVSLGLSELNPLIRHLVAVPVLLLIVKVAIPLLIAWLTPGKFLIPAIILLSLVVSWNVKELLIFLF